MTHPVYLCEKARQLRREKQLTIDEIAERLALSRTTIYYWLRDLPLTRLVPSTRQQAARRKGNLAMRRKYRLLRETAYDEARRRFSQLAMEPTFRDFITLYIAEGYKRDRNAVSLVNSDPVVVTLATRWIRDLSTKRLSFGLQYHADQDTEALRDFWGRVLEIAPESIQLYRKTNSGRLNGRMWRSQHGLLTVRVSDTLLRAKLQAWMDCLREEWRLNSSVDGA